MSRECDTCPEYKDYHCEKWCKVIRHTVADLEEYYKNSIPIEWIEKYVKSKTALLGDSELWIKWMIDDWQKEQEKQNESD